VLASRRDPRHAVGEAPNILIKGGGIADGREDESAATRVWGGAFAEKKNLSMLLTEEVERVSLTKGKTEGKLGCWILKRGRIKSNKKTGSLRRGQAW